MVPYKKDQGRMARMATFWSLAILAFWGSYALHNQLRIVFGGVLGRAFGADETGRGGLVIPVLAIQVSAAFLIALLVFGGAMFLIFRWTESPKIADLLIETEQELKKVTWPTWREVRDSSAVVILCVTVLLVFLATSDVVLARVSDYLLFGKPLIGKG
jgi:preprotein translocase SecE subunit